MEERKIKVLTGESRKKFNTLVENLKIEGKDILETVRKSGMPDDKLVSISVSADGYIHIDVGTDAYYRMKDGERWEHYNAQEYI